MKFSVKLRRNESDTFALLSEAYGGEAMKNSSNFEWHIRLAYWNQTWRQQSLLSSVARLLFTLNSFHEAKIQPSSCENIEAVTW